MVKSQHMGKVVVWYGGLLGMVCLIKSIIQRQKHEQQRKDALRDAIDSHEQSSYQQLGKQPLQFGHASCPQLGEAGLQVCCINPVLYDLPVPAMHEHKHISWSYVGVA